ncbi:hypothetical protein A2Y85_00945 [candidate division WOR-3 bacterium RBG_13_43_14]|uniref:Glutamine amidotransferase type-2 domain-containing protein n=1 Tax=candidate division WOR-3 bacterium RBG_13_43_14 TaxID=1802590 RepID=A0A1F4UB59_UNCW3|nr:MAG: hypothetical protein A2Y85_00945 [candidate division WOR-3 bacterium RBG_13_43_14]
MSDTTTIPAQMITDHLMAFRGLGYSNDDGWGIGYYVATSSSNHLAVIRRGEPSAPYDPRYVHVIGELLNSASRSAIAHVRRASSGPLEGIPDPHPFLRHGIFRDFEMIFAHNGTIPISPLYSLIQKTKPGYLALNPADYCPDYLDSDLFAIFIMQMIDLHPDSSVESCIKIAINQLAALITNTDAQFNFTMTDGHTLWAVKFSLGASDAVSLYYYPGISESDFWIVASEPLDTSKLWLAIPCSTLVKLVPDQAPVLIPLIDSDSSAFFTPSLEILYDNPGRLPVEIRYRNNAPTSIKIYDISGQLVTNFTLPYRQQGTVIWYGLDRHQRLISAGNYFCQMILPDTTCSIKLTILP